MEISERTHWVKFLRDLSAPFQVEAGSVVELSSSVLQGLQATPEGYQATFDITPSMLYRSLVRAYGVAEPQPAAALYAIPCPDCGMRPAAAFVHCQTCNDLKRVWTPNVVTHKALELSRRRFHLNLWLHSLEHYGQRGTDRWDNARAELLKIFWPELSTAKKSPSDGAQNSGQP